jgi:Na+/H+ antiporter NhaD/arsenite permease-like protein
VGRAGAAVIGAALMIASRVHSLGSAFEAVAYHAVVLLFGMMILVVELRILLLGIFFLL